jgi:hypothetical protein
MSMEIQCEERRLRMDERHLYAGPNLSGATEVSEPATEWLRIPEDTVMDDVARAACDPGYSWPLQAFAPATPVIAVAAQAAAEEPSPQLAQTPPQEPATLVKYAIQIGAYRNIERAEAAWKALSAEMPVLTRGHDFAVRPIKVKGKDLLRGLVLNFKSPQEGAAFCTALSGTGYGCILREIGE